MAMFGSNWLEDEPIDNDNQFIKHFQDDNDKSGKFFEYIDGDYIEIKYKNEYNRALNNNQLYKHDGESFISFYS